MSKHSLTDRIRRGAATVDARLTAYLAAASAVGASSAAHAGIVAKTTPQAFGINGEVNIDFNNDTQIDYQIDHDRVNLNGNNLDYLQIDKNDLTGAANPTVFPAFDTFPINSSAHANGDHAVVSFANPDNPLANVDDPSMPRNNDAHAGGYAVALRPGDVIGPTLPNTMAWDFQEGNNFFGTGKAIRANRLIDEDNTQIDQVQGGLAADHTYKPYSPAPGPGVPDDYVGLNGATRYLGVRLDFLDANAGLNYGWIGVRITNEADATGTVTGWAYETAVDTPILAGDTGVAGDYDSDGKVTGHDFLIWQQQFGATSAADIAANGNGNADANQDMQVNSTDYNTWAGAFGTSTANSHGAAGVVPEPGSMLLAVMGGGLVLGCWVIKRLRLRTTS